MTSRGAHWILSNASICLFFVCSGTAQAQPPAETISLASTTLTDQQVLTGRKNGNPATLTGELRIPGPGSDRLAAVILLHGSGGPGVRERDWSQQLNAMGVVAFMVNSFSGRGIASTVNDQDQLGRLAMAIDAYRALELLSKHPRIDPARIALMGFSRGGQGVLYSGLKRLYRMHGPAGGVEFAAYITFYANCGTRYVDDHDITDKPVRMFHGSADDYVPVAPCRSYVERLRANGKDVTLTEYAGAHHVFDGVTLRGQGFIKLAQAQTTRRCDLAEATDGKIINRQTGQPFTTGGDPCVERGTTIAYNPEAHADALRAVREFVAATLKPK